MAGAGFGLTVGLAALIGLTWEIPHGRGFLSLFGLVALVCLALGLTALWIPGIAWAMGLLGLEYGVRLGLDPDGTAIWAPLFGAALLVCAELCYLSLEIREEARARLRGRLFTVTGLALVAATAGAAILLAVGLRPPGGFAIVVIGTAATAALLGGLAALAGRGGSRA